MIGELPDIGLGTWKNTDPEQCATTVQTALEMGYRHIDTAQFYGNEAAVGDGIDRANVPREEVMIATKVHAESVGLGYDDVIEGAALSCERLGVEYLDILYVHWPIQEYEPSKTLAAFEELQSNGLIDSIGLSNYTLKLLEDAREYLETPFVTHQIEMHPFLHQSEQLAYAQEHGFDVVAYSPLAQGAVFDHPVMQSLSEKYDVSEAQLSLSWLLSKPNVKVIPKATSASHLRDNLEARHLELSDDDAEKIDEIEVENRYVERDDAPWLT
jgi:2,5-diketo-D-gluconate reductase B